MVVAAQVKHAVYHQLINFAIRRMTRFAGLPERGVRPGDPVRVRSALVHVGNSSMRLFHVMTNERTDERVATLEQLGVHLDMDARRPTPLPDAIRDRAKAILVS